MATIRKDFSNGDIIVYTINSIPSVTTDDWYLDSISSSNANVVATKIDDENFTLAINSSVDVSSTLSLVIGYRDNGTPNYVASRNISVDWVGNVVTDFIIQNTDSSAVNVTITKGSINNLNFAYKLNGEENYTTSTDTTNITIPVGRKLYMHSDTMTHWGGSSSNAANKIGISGSVSFGGNIMGLLANNVFSNDDYAFTYLFENCTSITTTPVLPATTLKPSCYKDMFSGCTGLTTISGLPATELATYCYQNMFKGCTSLTTTPTLAATILTAGCYDSMFYGCSGITTASTLPATTLANYCYQNMFNGCTSLTTAPELKALTLTTSCYYQMFYDCSSLNSISLYATNISASQCLYNWVHGVAATGTFTKMPTMTSLPTGDSGIPTGWTVTDIIIEAEPIKFTLTNDSSSGTISLRIGSDVGTSYYEYVEWSLDKTNWTRINNVIDSEVTVVTSVLNPGDSVYFRGKGECTAWNSYTSAYSNFIFASGVKANCEGDIMSLIGKTMYDALKYRGFYKLFTSTNIINAGDLILSATTLVQYCYQNMFSSCTSLTTAPALPATTLVQYCYQNMFSSCTSLTTAPALPATTLANNCYYQMFYGCTSLTTAPALPATTLAEGCYYSMFNGCTGLTTAPALPATTLARDCYYNMFNGCTGLTTAPELPATTLAINCYYQMFYGCTSLTTAPELPATTLAAWCYYSMFRGCTALTSLPNNLLPATTLANYCYNSMFYNCTGLTTTPTLPATTLAQGCYNSMFNGCTGLTTAPALPATTLAQSCYYSMFNSCVNLNYIKCLATNISANNCLFNWVSGVQTTSGTFVKDPNMNDWPTGENGIPNNWTVVNNTAS